MALKWNRELTQKLITCIEENDCIYNVKSKEYLDRDKKAQAMNTILKELQSVECKITIEEIKRKWKNLRTQYCQEKRRVKQSQKSGAGTDDVYVPKLWCFQQLNFLQPHTDVRDSVDNIEVATQDSQSETCSTQEESSFDEIPAKRKKGSSAMNAVLNEVQNFQKLINRKKTEKKYAWLGNLVASRMEDIHLEDQDDAAWQIQCLMQKLCSQSAGRKRFNSTSSSTSEISEEAPSCSKYCKNIAESSQSVSSESRDILELSMQGIFDDDDFVE